MAAEVAAVESASGLGWHVEVTPHDLDVARYMQLVSDPSAGAIASFVGVTRNSFQDRAVLKLEYEAYAPMAISEMKKVCESARRMWPSLCKMAVAHRTGVVAVCEASVVITTSSPHRRDALEATSWAIDELKSTVPIWKREFFEDGSVWKENAESRLQQRVQAQPAAVT